MFKRIWGTISTVLVVAVVILALLLVGARVFGLQVYTVLSGSMEPNYHVGSVIYVKKVDPKSLQVGDPISFVINENTVATHRIIEVIPDENDPNVIRFRTKGDNNDIADSNPVHCNNVLGKVVGTIPYLGYISDFVQNPPGTYITLGGAALLILIVFVPDFLGIGEKKQQDTPPVAEEVSFDNEKLKAELEALKQKIQQQECKTDEQKEGNEHESI